MKGIVVFDTSYGNTRAIAEAIAEALRESGIEVHAFYVKDVKKLDAQANDFLIVGSPTRLGTFSFAVNGFLGKVKSEAWLHKPFAAFDTELPQNIEKGEGSAAEKIAGKLKDKQMVQLLPVLKSVVLETKGFSLKEGEVERARDYARRLADELKRSGAGSVNTGA